MKVTKKRVAVTQQTTFSLIAVVALVAVSVLIQNRAARIKDASLLQDGMGTCFARGAQSYTAKLLGQVNSIYLESQFMKTTEECFGETVQAAEAMSAGVFEEVAKGLNTLSSEAHWLHQKLETRPEPGLVNSNPPSVIVSNVGSRYEKLELKRDEIAEQIDIIKTANASVLNRLKVALYFLAVFVPFLLIWEMIGHYVRSRRVVEIDNEALGQVKSDEQFDYRKAEDTILNALKDGEYQDTARLFESYRTRMTAVSPTLSSQEDTTGTMAMASIDPKRLNEQIEKMWNESEEVLEVHNRNKKVAQAPVVDVEETLSKVIDILSSKIFTYGIHVDVDIDEGVRVEGKVEDLEQTFYHILVHAIESHDFEQASKHVNIRMRRLGNTVLIDFFDSGRGFSEEFLRTQIAEGGRSKENVELAISKHLIEESGGKISFENVANAEGLVVGSKIQLPLKKPEPKSRLVDIKRGSKRDILNRIAGTNV